MLIQGFTQNIGYSLYEVFGGELNRLYELPFSALDKFVTSDRGWIAIFTKEDLPRVICWNVKSMESITLPLENRYTPLAITFSSEVLFELSLRASICR